MRSFAMKSAAMREMGAAEFKTSCLSVMNDVQHRGEPVLVTKKGKPSVIVTAAPSGGDPLARYKFGGGRITGDIVSPVVDRDDWTCD